MPSILGFTTAAASVELNRLDVVDARKRCVVALAEGADRSWRAQVCAAYRQDMAIVVDWEFELLNNLNSLVCEASMSRTSRMKESGDWPKVFELGRQGL